MNGKPDTSSHANPINKSNIWSLQCGYQMIQLVFFIEEIPTEGARAIPWLNDASNISSRTECLPSSPTDNDKDLFFFFPPSVS